MKKIFLLFKFFLVVKLYSFGQLNESLTTGLLPVGWIASSPTDVIFATTSGGYANLTSVAATLTTPSLNIPVGSKLQFDFAKFGSGADGPLTVTINNGITSQVITTVIPTSTFISLSPTLITSTGASVTITFSRSSSPSQKRFKNVIISSTALAVDLKSFSITKNNSKNNLAWQTTSEKNNAQFNVEHSADGESFFKIGEIKGKGNSTVEQKYFFTDPNPLQGINYYRLKQVDFDGTTTFSKIVSIDNSGRGQKKVKVYPSITDSEVNVELSDLGKTEITIRDVSGRLILSKNTEGVTNQILDLSSFINGLYFLSVRTSDTTETVKIQKH
jgi:hypothetical protein